MEKKVTGEALCLLILLILFAKNAVNFFIEGGDKSAVALILFNLIIILGLIFCILNKEKINKYNEDLKQIKLDKYFCLNKGKT